MARSVRDRDLLDALEQLSFEEFEGIVWRSVRENRLPDKCARGGARWDDGSFDTLYTSSTRDGAIEERRFHLFKGQPFPPSKVKYEIHELRVELSSMIRIDTLVKLNQLGLDTSKYGQLSYVKRDGEYPHSQTIAEACMFLGADGICVPNARHESTNIVVFCEQTPPPTIHHITNHGFLEW